jgi:hypothetical protein
MKLKTRRDCRNPYSGDNAFWRIFDRISDFMETPKYTYITLGLILVGTLLGIIGDYLQR